ncbi:MAG: sulfite exporter TauE/SafE family protein [Paracoccaceae bacterium]|nr:MAG: sulfite exporter TauE/SafE family protein [Paracoccaceae bacterium]
MDASFGGAALAGLLSFFSPCVLPMVPFYLCYLAGISMQELRGAREMPPDARRRLVIQSAIFALGVTTIFVMLGMGATALGRGFAQWREPLSWVAAGILIVFGLHFLGVLRLPFLMREMRSESTMPPSTLAGAYAMGLAFGFGWTPCVGPALAAILMVATAMQELWRGGLLLLVYGLAMTLPFVIVAVFAGPFLRWVSRHRGALAHVEKVMGVMLIAFGLLIATGSVNLIADFMIRNFDWSATLI